MATARHSLGLWDWYDRFPMVRDEDVLIPPLNDIDPTTWRPYAYPWPGGAADQWGVAFPAGIVAVSLDCQEGLGGLSGDPLEDRIEDQLETTMYAVPGVLPVGYTENRYEEWPTPIGLLPSSAPRPSINIGTHYRDATGPVPLDGWAPSSQWDGYLGSGPSSPVGVGVWYGSVERNPGWRKVQAQIGCFTLLPGGFVLTPVQFNGTVTLKLSHNADGTDPGSADGDTIDFTLNVTRPDFSVAAGRCQTGWIDCGSALASLGVNSYFVGSLDFSALTASPETAPGWYVSLRLSPRMDIPFPSLVTGVGGLIAPGGYV